MTSNEQVKSKKNKLKGGDRNDDNAAHGRDFIEQAFSSISMADFLDIIKKILIYKTEFYKQLISKTKNHFQRDLKLVKIL